MKNAALRKSTIVISYLVFLIGWTIRVYCVDLSGLDEYTSWGIGFFIHLVWWPAFAFLLIKMYDNELNISLKEMLSTKPGPKILLPCLAFAVVYNGIGHFVSGSSYGTTMKLYDLMITVLTVGIFEESVFRGWFLNAISKFTSEKKANMISSLLFVLIHYPGWICGGYQLSVIAVTSVSVFALGLLFGFVLIRSRSIWTGAILHSMWDLLTWI